MKQIALNDGYVVLLDDDVAYSLDLTKLKAYPDGQTVYVRYRGVMLHRYIMAAPVGVLVDHCNGNGLDDRRENLRLANHSQNAANRRVATPTKGVRFSTSTNKWKATLRCQGRKWCATFDYEFEALKAYDAKAREMFGEFAWTNADQANLDSQHMLNQPVTVSLQDIGGNQIQVSLDLENVESVRRCEYWSVRKLVCSERGGPGYVVETVIAGIRTTMPQFLLLLDMGQTCRYLDGNHLNNTVANLKPGRRTKEGRYCDWLRANLRRKPKLSTK